MYFKFKENEQHISEIYRTLRSCLPRFFLWKVQLLYLIQIVKILLWSTELTVVMDVEGNHWKSLGSVQRRCCEAARGVLPALGARGLCWAVSRTLHHRSHPVSAPLSSDQLPAWSAQPASALPGWGAARQELVMCNFAALLRRLSVPEAGEF